MIILPTRQEDQVLNIVEALADLVLTTTALLNLLKKKKRMTYTVETTGLMI